LALDGPRMAQQVDVVLTGRPYAWRKPGLRLDVAGNFPILAFTGEHTVDLPDTLVKTVWATVKGR